MNEVTKAVGQWIVGNLGWSAIILLFILSCLFKVTKKEIDPLGWVIGWIGKAFTKDVRRDILELKNETHRKFDELRTDYNSQIVKLQKDLDSFEERTNVSINGMTDGTARNCEILKSRIDELEASQQKSNDMQTVQNIRTHILDFANTCFSKRKHTKREFENIIDENAKYEELVEKYDIKNNVYREDYDFILKVYHNCQEEGTLLKEGD